MKKTAAEKKEKMNGKKIMCLVLAGLMVISAASTILMIIASSL